MGKKSFILHNDSLLVLKELSNEQAGILFKAIADFQNNIEPELEFSLKMAFLPFRNQFARDKENYENKVETNKINGSLGGKQKVANATETKRTLPNATERYQTVANVADSDSDKDSGSEKEKKNLGKKEGGSTEGDVWFEKFWQAYPKKVSKGTAGTAWRKINPSDELSFTIIESVKKLKETVDWKKENFRYVLKPENWLTAKGWEDEVTENSQQEQIIPTSTIGRDRN